MKVLILQSSSLRHLLLSTPIIRALKTQLEAEVHLNTKISFKEILSGNPYLDQIHLEDTSIVKAGWKLRGEKFDAVIDLQNDLKSSILKIILGRKSYSYKKKGLKRWLFIHFKIKLLSNTHIIEQMMEDVEPLGIKEDNLGLDYFIPDMDIVENDWLPETHRSGYVAFAISARFKTQQLPINRMIELCDRINKPIILIGGKEDVGIANEIEAFFKPGSKTEEKEIESLNKRTSIFNACGKFNFNQSASLIERANWVFTHDNDMMHIASAFKKKIFTLWGSTIPEFGQYPYRTQFTIFENKNLSCRPCSAGGFSKCPKGHFKCMNNLTFDFYLPD